MRIALRIALGKDAEAALSSDAELARICARTIGPIELYSDDPRFQRLLEVTKDTSGCWLNPIVRFTQRELAQARYYQPYPRRVVGEVERDSDTNLARIQACDFHRIEGRRLRIKLIDRIALSRIALKPDTVAGVGEWLTEFVVGRVAVEAFRAAGFTGYTLRPIVQTRTGKPYRDYFHLYSESIMPGVRFDATTPVVERDLPEEGGRQQRGCLTYALRGDEEICDFNRTAEDWGSNSQPVWVVTARVRDCVLRHKIKGWVFRPVLEEGGALQQHYLAVWGDLLERVKINPRNFF